MYLTSSYQKNIKNWSQRRHFLWARVVISYLRQYPPWWMMPLQVYEIDIEKILNVI